MNKPFDIKEYVRLARIASKTEYYKKADWSTWDLDELLKSTPEEQAECEHSDILKMTEDLAYAIQQEQLPPEVAALAQYGYQLAFELNDAGCINDLGVLYYTGRMGEQDFGKAAQYYKMASDLGMALSTENLGYIYYYGRTGEVNYEMAYQLFSKASAAHNRACATYKLGDMFKNGYYVERDIKSALECYKRAEKLIDDGQPCNRAANVAPDIYFRLGECYHLGSGTEVDLDKALDYYQRAERGFIVKVREGDFLVKKMLVRSIERQDEVREKIIAALPTMSWARPNRGYLDL